MRFSVIIPNYNNEKWLEKCLKSVLDQTFQDFEIIFVDDMSTDGSLEVARSLLRRHDDKVIENESRRLNGGSRNVGILRAKGDYIICLDSDDWLKNDHVFEDIDKALKGEDIMFLDYEVLWDENVSNTASFNFQNLREALTNDTCAIWTKVVKSDLLKQTLFPEGNLFEDRVHHYRLVRKAKTFSCLKKVTHVWNKTNKNSTSQDTFLYDPYKAHYIGELLILARELEKGDEFRNHLKGEIKAYLEVLSKMTEEL